MNISRNIQWRKAESLLSRHVDDESPRRGMGMVAALLLTLVFHLGLWFLPVSLPVNEPAPPKTIKLSLVPNPPAKRALTAPVKPKVRPKPTRRRRVRRRHRKRRRIRRKRRRVRRKRRRKLYRRKRARQLMRRRIPARPPVKGPEPRRIVPPLPAPRPVVKEVPAPRVPPAPSRPMPVVRRVPVPRPVARPVDFGPYKMGLFRSIRKQKRYPFMARRMGQEGTVVLLIRVSSTGHLIGTPKVIRSSTYSLLDREAKRMIRAAAPWPAMPSGYQGAPRQFRVQIRFSLDS